MSIYKCTEKRRSDEDDEDDESSSFVGVSRGNTVRGNRTERF